MIQNPSSIGVIWVQPNMWRNRMKVTHTLLYVTQLDLRKCREVQISQYGVDLELKQARRTGKKILQILWGPMSHFN